MNAKKAPTMRDVALRAGVALGTVSKVINGIPVSEKNRLKVEEAIASLNYEVNTYARGLKTQKSNLVALIIPNSIPFLPISPTILNPPFTGGGSRCFCAALTAFRRRRRSI